MSFSFYFSYLNEFLYVVFDCTKPALCDHILVIFYKQISKVLMYSRRVQGIQSCHYLCHTSPFLLIHFTVYEYIFIISPKVLFTYLIIFLLSLCILIQSFGKKIGMFMSYFNYNS